MNPPPVPLSYGQPRRRPRVLRYLVVSLLLGVGVAGWHWRKPIRAAVETAYWLRRLKTYQQPPDFVVFETDPVAGGKLLASVKGYRRRQFQGEPFFDYTPDVWTHFKAFQWQPAPFFVHELRTPSGGRRLVTVIATRWGGAGSGTAISIYPIDYKLTGDGPTQPVQSDGLTIVFTPQENMTLFAGQTDPADPSHFTLDYRFGTHRGTLDGRLGNDNQIVLRPRDGRYPARGYPHDPRYKHWAPPGSKWASSAEDVPVVPGR